SLVVDHLASNGLLQSLAVFLPESGLGSSSYTTTATTTAAAAAANTTTTSAGPLLAPVSALSREDVLQGLTIHEDSPLFRRVISRAEGGGGSLAGAGAGKGAGGAASTTTEASALGVAATAREEGEGGGAGGGRRGGRVCGLLEALVDEVAAGSRTGAVDSNTQTDEAGRSHKENLVTRLEAVRETWLRRAADERREPARDVAERMLAYQRECEARAVAQGKADRDSFRERDLAALRLQMTKVQRGEMDSMRKELQVRWRL
ncbi:unnamed protein product, partial [Laminaria digitata]